MPKSRKAKSKGGRGNGGRAPPNAGELTLVRTPKGFPHKMQMRHEYSDYGVFVNTAGAISNAFFSTNGMYDPDASIGGHQPLYFDQMAAIYRHYTVIRSTCEWEFLPYAIPYAVASYVDDDATVASSVVNALEQATGKGGIYPNNAVRAHKLHNSWSAQEYFGGDTLDNDNLQGTVSANPAEQSWFTLVYRPADSVTTGNFYWRVKIVYDAVWDELLNISGS